MKQSSLPRHQCFPSVEVVLCDPLSLSQKTDAELWAGAERYGHHSVWHLSQYPSLLSIEKYNLFPDHVCGGQVALCWCTLTSQISPTCLTGTQSSCLCYLRPTTRPRRMWVLLTWFYTIPCAHTGGEPVSWDKNMYITLHGNWETYSSIAYTHTGC